LERLNDIGKYMKRYSSTIKGTKAGDVAPQDWGATTRKDNHLYVHITNKDTLSLELPLTCKVKKAIEFDTQKKVPFKKTPTGVLLTLNEHKDKMDYIIDLETK
ncbi:MAG: alpha-L-fucosidase, partial [Bacteroidaceae bacterium]|nr:alpha-L-fucosidase [Bacteroidaceae bacterium]